MSAYPPAPLAQPGPPPPAPPVPLEHREPRLPRRLLGAVWQLIRYVVVDPVRTGRLRLGGLPLGLAAIAATGLVLCALGLAVVATSAQLRQVLPVTVAQNGLGAPTAVLGVVVAMFVLGLAMISTAALHAPWWGRAAGLGVAAAYLCVIGYQLSTTATAVVNGAIYLVGWLVLVALTILRSRARFAWWEFVIVLAVYVTCTAGTAWSALPRLQVLTPGAYVDFTWIVLLIMGFLAFPLVTAAGYAIAEIAYTTVVWGVDLTRATVSRTALVVIMVIVLAWRLFAETKNWLETLALSAPRVLASTIVIMVAIALGFGLDRLADRGRSRHPSPWADETKVADIADDLQRVLLPIAVLIAVPSLLRLVALAVPGYVGQVVALAGAPGIGDVVRSSEAWLEAAAAFLGGLWPQVVLYAGILAAAAWQARRGRRGLASLLGTLALLRLATLVPGLGVAYYYLPLVVVWLVVGLAIVFAAMRLLTPRRVEALIVVALLAAAFGSREIFDNPLEVLVGGSAAVLFGLGWSILTGADNVHEDTPRLPRTTRVLFFVGYTLFTITLVMFVSLTSSTYASFDVEATTQLGDEIFGGALLVAAIVTVMINALRDDEVGPAT